MLHIKQVIVISLLLATSLSCAPLNVGDGTLITPSVSRITLSATPPAPKARPAKGQPTPQAYLPLMSGPSAAPYDLILGRPTTDTIAASLYATTDITVAISYGPESSLSQTQTAPLSLKAYAPQTITLTQLLPDTAYRYRVITADSQALSDAILIAHRFHTSRAPGSTFTFTIDADPHHRDPNFNGELYIDTLTNTRNDQPDFHINLGDTFMTEKVLTSPRTYTAAVSTFTDMRPYFSLIGADAPLFLVNGNHEGELGWFFGSRNDSSMPVWSTQLRQLYYPNPTPNGFYSGATTPDPALGAARDGYYAWTWGDAQLIVLDPFWYTSTKPQPTDLTQGNWNWTLGKAQYDWLKATLESSTATFKFVFIHHLVGGSQDARGGIEFAPYYEWGGKNLDGSDGFAAHRPGWDKPIHQLLVDNKVNAVFHGHDHVFVKQDLDGIVYQEMPQPNITNYNNTSLAAEYGYVNGEVRSSSGHLRVIVSPTQVTVDYVRAYLLKDIRPTRQNGQVDFSYAILP